MTRARDVASNGGIVLLNSTSFSAASSVIVDNIFTSTYDNYVITLYLSAISAAGDTNFELRTAGARSGGGNFQYNITYGTFNSGASTYNTPTGAVTYGKLTASGAPAGATMTLFRPWAVSQTMYTQSFSTNDGIYANGAGRFTGAVTSDGFLINRGSGTMTGAVRVYGYRN